MREGKGGEGSVRGRRVACPGEWIADSRNPKCSDGKTRARYLPTYLGLDSNKEMKSTSQVGNERRALLKLR